MFWLIRDRRKISRLPQLGRRFESVVFLKTRGFEEEDGVGIRRSATSVTDRGIPEAGVKQREILPLHVFLMGLPPTNVRAQKKTTDGGKERAFMPKQHVT